MQQRPGRIDVARMIPGQQLERDQRGAAAGRARVVEAAPKQLELLPEPELTDRPVGDRPLAVVRSARRRLQLVVPLRAQLRELALGARLRETVGLRRGLGERHETDCSDRDAGPM